MTATFANIELSAIRASKTNPRKTFNQVGLEELAASIREMGVAQPILVRPHPESDEFIKYEIVAGERRYRASIMANATTIPSLIRDLTDRQALELQVIENLQREDVHPLEEAEGYDQLMKMHGVTADQLVDKVGKSRSYVYARLKLLDLEPDTRQAFYDSKLNPSTALLIARLPRALQSKASEEITTPLWNGEPMSYRDAKAHIQKRYMLQLSSAPFDTTNESLLFEIGSCAQCPKRTGNQPELFSDIESADVCTDPDCFASKREAQIVFIKDQAAQNGQRIISGDEALKINPDDYLPDIEEHGYIVLDDACYEDEQERTYRQILGDNCPTPILYEDPHSEEPKLIEILKRAEVEHILKEGIVPVNAPSSQQNAKTAENASKKASDAVAARQKLDEDIKKERQAREKLFHAVRDKLNGDLALGIRQIIAKILADATYDNLIPKLHGWEESILQHPNCEKALPEAIDKLNEKQLNMLLIDLILVDELTVNSWSIGKIPQHLHAAAAAAGINPLTLKVEGGAKSKQAPTAKHSNTTWPFPNTKKQIDEAEAKKSAKKVVAKTAAKPAAKKPTTKPAAKKAAPSKKPVKVTTKPKAKAAKKK